MILKLRNRILLVFEYWNLASNFKNRLISYAHELTLMQESLRAASKYDFDPGSRVETTESNFVFQYWEQGFENAPSLVKACINSVKLNLGDMKHVFLDSTNLRDWVTVPESVLLARDSGHLNSANFADYLRASLLSKYGGIWLDATCLVTDAEFFTFLSRQNFFAFQTSSSLFRDSLSEMGNIHFSSWCLKSTKNSPTFSFIEQQIRSTLTKKGAYPHYYYFHILLTAARNHTNSPRFEFSNLSKNCFNIDPHLLQFELLSDFNPDEYSEILRKSPIHKLAHQDLKNHSLNGDSVREYIEKLYS
jgi:hypothetical protein